MNLIQNHSGRQAEQASGKDQIIQKLRLENKILQEQNQELRMKLQGEPAQSVGTG